MRLRRVWRDALFAKTGPFSRIGPLAKIGLVGIGLAGTLLAGLLFAGWNGPRPDAPRAALEQRRADLQRAVAGNPTAIAERVELTRIALRLGDGIGAETMVKAAIAAGGNIEALRPLLARAQAMQGDGRRALATLDSGPIIPEMAGEAAWVAGDVHLANGDLDAARGAYDRALLARPRDAALWIDVARFRGAKADMLGAHNAIDYAIELDDGNSDALAFKGSLVRTQQGLLASLGWYDKALSADPDNRGALIEKAATLGDLGRYRDMLTTLRRAALLGSGDPRLYYLQAVLAARAGNYPLARSLLQRTRGAMDDVPGFMLLSAVVDLELGGEALAATWAERLLAEQPHNFTARRLLAAAEWAAGDADGAAEALAPLVVRADADSWSLLLAARVAAARGQDDQAALYQAQAAPLTRGEAAPFAVDNDSGFLAMAAASDPLNPAKVIPAIAADIRDGLFGRAMARATALRDANPGVADAHILVGDTALAGGPYAAAIPSYRAAHNLDGGERTTLRLANVLFQAGDTDGSGALILALRDNYSPSIAADRIAGHLAMDSRHWDRAIAHFERVRRRMGNRDAVLLRELAKAYTAKGQRERALSMIAKAYRLQPLNADIMLLYADLLTQRGDGQGAEDLRDKARQIGR